MDHLALQVREIHHIVVHQADAPDAGGGDAGWVVERCAPKVLRDKDGSIATKLVLTMFHFNLQYVATDIPENLKKYEDAIIKIGFKPLLDVLDEHPSWAFSLEFQGYMLEQMAKNHPKVFDQFKAQAATCQAEFVSFHYSDQLFLAYPALDLERSHELLDELLAEAGLTEQLGHGIELLLEPTMEAYLASFNALMARTDVLWSKPSEISFFAALGLPLVLSAPVGAQEVANRAWVLEQGAGIDQRAVSAAAEWLLDLVEDGLLAASAWTAPPPDAASGRPPAACAPR